MARAGIGRNAGRPRGVPIPMERADRPTALTPEALLAHRRWLEDLGVRLAGDPHEGADAAQETWVRALERPPGTLRSARAWLAAVVRNCVRDRRRGEARRGARERAAARPEAAGTLSPADLVARAEAQRRVLDAVLALEEPARSTVLLRFFQDLAPGEIAARLGEPPGTVRSRLHRALAALRETLDREYGGDRAAWVVVLGVPGGTALVPAGGASAAGSWKGGLVAMGAKTKVAAGAAVLLLALLAWRTLGDGPPPAPPPDGIAAAAPRPPAGSDEVGVPAEPPEPEAPAPAASDPAPEPSPPAAPPGPRRLEFAVLPPRAEEPAEESPARAGGAKVHRWEDLEKEGVVVSGEGSGFGGMRLEPGGSKWAPVPEKGTVTLRGTVVDRAGRPLAGAEVFRIDPEAGGVEGEVVSFRHIKRIAVAGEDGSFEARTQPARPVRLAANWLSRMNRPRGLLFANLLPVDPAEEAVLADLVLRVPVDRDAVGRIEGVVADDRGEPLPQVRLFAGFQEAMTDAAGRFRFDPVAAGEVALRVQHYGWKEIRRTVPVAAGESREVEIRLEPALAGNLELAGRVVDERGEPVPDLPLWCGGGPFGFAREARTAKDGSFRFERIPESLEGKTVSVSVMTDPDEAGIFPATRQGIRVPTSGLVLEVERCARLRALVRDAETGEPLPLFRAEVEREKVVDGETTLVPFHSLSIYREDGVFELTVPKGRLVFLVEAPDHQPFHGEVRVPDVDGPWEVVVDLYR